MLATYRWYSPELGRWLSRDPIGYEGGVNLYEYVKGRVVIYLDPRGLESQLLLHQKGMSQHTIDEYINPNNNPDEFAVNGHGSVHSLSDNRTGKMRRMTPEELLEMILSDAVTREKFARSKYVKFYACSVGGGVDSFAEQFYELLKKRNMRKIVKAPTKPIWFFVANQFVTIAESSARDPNVPDLRKPGAWVTFNE